MRKQVSKTELSPDNGAVIDTKWSVGGLIYHAYARTNLSFHYLGDFWNDRISCVIVVSGVWRFYRDEYYKGDYWDLGPGFYESFFTAAGPDDVVSSFQAIALT